MREALDRAAARSASGFRTSHSSKRRSEWRLAKAIRRLDEVNSTRWPHLERAVALRQAHLGPDHPDTLASMDNLADAYSWAARHSDAIALRQRFWRTGRHGFGPDHPETLARVRDLAELISWLVGGT